MLYKSKFKENNEYDLKSKYKRFNKLYFNSELPDVPIKWETSKRVVGGGAYPLKINGDIVGLEKIELSQNFYNYIIPEVIEDVYDSMLIHEMIHGWVFQNIGRIKNVHGLEFKNKLKDILKKSNFKFFNLTKPTTLEIPNNFWIRNNKNISRKTNMIG